MNAENCIRRLIVEKCAARIVKYLLRFLHKTLFVITATTSINFLRILNTLIFNPK